jgi:hypothetical protein
MPVTRDGISFDIYKRRCLMNSSLLLTLKTICMDDPKKKGADAKRRSQQPHELAYQKRKAKKRAAPKKKAAKKSAAKKSAPKKKAAKKKAAKKKSAR